MMMMMMLKKSLLLLHFGLKYAKKLRQASQNKNIRTIR